MTKAAVFLYTLSLIGCGNNVQVVDSSNTANMSKTDNVTILQEPRPDCALDLRSLRSFYAAIPNDFRNVDSDNRFIARLQACPREDVVAKLTGLLNLNQRDYEIRTKITYLFIKLDHDKEKNKKNLLDLFNSYPYDEAGKGIIEPDRVIDMVCDVVLQEDDGGFLSHVFDLKTDASSTTMLYGCLAEVLERRPEPFLRQLNTKPKSKRESVYSSLCTAAPKKELLAVLSNIKKESDVQPLSLEMAAFVNRSPICGEF